MCAPCRDSELNSTAERATAQIIPREVSVGCAVLTVPAETLIRVSCNPFFPYLAARLASWRDEKTAGRQP